MARSFPWKCRTCGKQTVNPKVVDYSAELQHDGRTYPVTVPQVEVLQCDECGTVVLTDVAHEALADALRDAAGLMSPDEIRSHREKLGLTQKELATYLKVSESTVSRWETGGQIQQRAMDLLLRGYFNVKDLREYCARLAGARVPGASTINTATITITSPVSQTNAPAAIAASSVGQHITTNSTESLPVWVIPNDRGLTCA